MRATPPQDFLEECFDYNSVTGELTWRTRPLSHFCDAGYYYRWNTRFAGKPAGSTKSRYPQIQLAGHKEYLHRIVWKLATGNDANNIDHINGDHRDNRLSNLRSVSGAENSMNLPVTCKNNSGVVGVSYSAKGHGWYAYIKVSGRMHNLGVFKDKLAAIAARKTAEKKYGFHPNHGRPQHLCQHHYA